MRVLRSRPLSTGQCIPVVCFRGDGQNGAPASRIVRQIDESQLVTLKGTVHPLANAKNDRGALPTARN